MKVRPGSFTESGNLDGERVGVCRSETLTSSIRHKELVEPNSTLIHSAADQRRILVSLAPPRVMMMLYVEKPLNDSDTVDKMLYSRKPVHGSDTFDSIH